MAKLTKAQAKAHAEACALLEKDRLSEDERWFVIENWQESANHINSTAGAFFTPWELARDFSIEVSGSRTIVDLCAGIGTLSFFAALGRSIDRMVCVETNPDYLRIGRKVVPEAEWIEADVFKLPDIGRFDCAISNPPFGTVKRSGRGGRYTGRAFEYHVIALAESLADYGVFIIPQNSAPFRYSGHDYFKVEKTRDCLAFEEATGIKLGPSCGIDCSQYRDRWRGVAPAVEIVCADFVRESPVVAGKQADLFEAA